ncbi:MAG TPA: lysylphosphatidylglycerol synthase transmembrane domain-containing protein [Fibrobacteria bacterium]|nr:lysylphosphatidylglycerol synthase transmembrane domain-containing protein [Fibrobacteria bacterium]
MKKARLRLCAKVLVSAACLAAVGHWVDPAVIAAKLRGIAWPPFLAAVAIHVVLQWVNALKVHLLFPPPRPALKTMVAVNFITVFFGTFIPGGIGGELARWAYLTRESGSKDRTLATILLDRITGLWTQVMLVLAAWIWMDRHALALWAAIPIALGILAGSLWAGIRGYRGCIRAAQKLGDWYARRTGRSAPVPESVIEAMEGLLASRRRFAKVAALALAFHGLVILDFLLLNRSIGGGVDWATAVLFLFGYTVILLAPVSVGNLGFSEGTLGVLYHLAGSDSGTGVLISLLLRAMAVPSALLGWILFLVRKRGSGSGVQTPEARPRAAA